MIIGLVGMLLIILLIKGDSASAEFNDPNLYLYTEANQDILRTVKPTGNDPETKAVYQTGHLADNWYDIAEFYTRPMEKEININDDVDFELWFGDDDTNPVTSAEIEIKVYLLDHDGNEIANSTSGAQNVNNDPVLFTGSLSVDNFFIEEGNTFGINISYRFAGGASGTPTTNLQMFYESNDNDAHITVPCNDYVSITVQVDDHPSDDEADIEGTIEDAFGSEDILDYDFSIIVSGNSVEAEMSENHKRVTGTWDYSEENSGTYFAEVRIKDQNEYYWVGEHEFTISRGEANVNLECSQSTKDVDPGYPVKYIITVKNDGNRQDTINLKVTDKRNGWDYTFENDKLTLESQTQQDIYVEIDVPTKTIKDRYSTTILGTSSLDNGVTDTQTLKTEVNSDFDIELECKDPTKNVAPGKSVEFQLTVKNIGNDVDTVLIQKDISNWANSLSEFEFGLDYGEWANLTFTLEAPKNANEGDKNTITISAVSRGNSQKVSSKIITGEIKYEVIINTNKKTFTIEQDHNEKITLTIENMGSESVDISFEVEDYYIDWMNFESDTLTIDGGTSEDIELKIDVPSNADTKTHTIKIIGKENDNSITPTIELKIRVEEKDEGIESYLLTGMIAAALVISLSVVFISRHRGGYDDEEEDDEEEEEKLEDEHTEMKEKAKKEKSTLKKEKPQKQDIKKTEPRPPRVTRSTPIRKQAKPPTFPQPTYRAPQPAQPYRSQQQPIQPYRAQPPVQQPWGKPQKQVPTKIRGVGITQQIQRQPQGRIPSKPLQARKPTEIPVVTGVIPKPQTPIPITQQPSPIIPKSPQMGPPLPEKIPIEATEKTSSKKKLSKKEAKELKKKEKEEKKKMKKEKKKKKWKKKSSEKTETSEAPIAIAEEETYTVADEGIAVVEEDEGIAVVEEVEAVEVVEEEEEEVYAVVEEE